MFIAVCIVIVVWSMCSILLHTAWAVVLDFQEHQFKLKLPLFGLGPHKCSYFLILVTNHIVVKLIKTFAFVTGYGYMGELGNEDMDELSNGYIGNGHTIYEWTCSCNDVLTLSVLQILDYLERHAELFRAALVQSLGTEHQVIVYSCNKLLCAFYYSKACLFTPAVLLLCIYYQV